MVGARAQTIYLPYHQTTEQLHSCVTHLNCTLYLETTFFLCSSDPLLAVVIMIVAKESKGGNQRLNQNVVE